MQRLLLLLAAIGLNGLAFAQSPAKRPMTTADFAPWTLIQSPRLSPDGRYATWEERPQQDGDGDLLIQALPEGAPLRFERAGNAAYAGDGSFYAFRVSPPFDSLRAARLAKVPAADQPKDSLFVWRPGAELLRFPRVKSYKTPQAAGSWMAFHEEKPLPEKKKKGAEADSTAKDSVAAKPKPKEGRLVLLHPASGQQLEVANVQSYALADSGNLMAMVVVAGDSVDSARVQLFDPQRKQFRVIYEGMGKVKQLTFDRSGKRLAFLATTDTGEVKLYHLYGYRLEEAQARRLVDTATSAMPDGWAVSEHSSLSFSRSGRRLLFDTAPAPKALAKDTLLDEEKARVDVWTWQDKQLMPQQMVGLEEEKKRGYLAVWLWEEARMVQLGDSALPSPSLPADQDGPLAMATDDRSYAVSHSWSFPWLEDIWVMEVETGERRQLVKGQGFGASLSPQGQFLVYWNSKDRSWLSMNTAQKQVNVLTQGLEEAFYDEDHDSPHEPGPYGFAGFVEGEQAGLFYDRYDLWLLSLDGSSKPVNLTKGWGRKNKVQLRVRELDPEAIYLPDSLMLHGTWEVTKSEGIYAGSSVDKMTPEMLLEGPMRFSGLQKARHAGRYLWRRETFQEFPQLWTGTTGLASPAKLTSVNQQQDSILWGSVELVHWTAYDGTKLEGLLYQPEGLNPSGSYPLLVYFYERSADRLHSYSLPSPSRSTINPAYYLSQGYAVFMPDIVYKEGQPGEDAYNCIVSGTEAMLKQFPWIDSTRMALQGQSWGGYQTAYLVTRTNRFACAMAGAPVSNMTSAYGGIRWGTGISRMFQYEQTQSRLGTTLWEDRERYLRNSPVFFADKVETPLLMMHNDADGAVPWYQGIEYFVALRRLEKPVWMVVYNDEEHNLTRWPNRMDLTLRMHQFFDHYLMGKPAPRWMAEGVPATQKGIDPGFELTADE